MRFIELSSRYPPSVIVCGGMLKHTAFVPFLLHWSKKYIWEWGRGGGYNDATGFSLKG